MGRCGSPKEAYHSLARRSTDGPEWARPMEGHHIEESNCPSETHNPVNDTGINQIMNFYLQLRLVLHKILM